MNKFLAIAVAGFAVVAASQASAATYSVTGTFGPTKTDFSNAAFSVAGFNTSLGTLTAVSVSLSASATVSGSVTNNTTSAQTFKVSTTTSVIVNSATSNGIDGITVDLNSTQTYSAVAAGATAAYGPYTPSATSASVVGTPLSAYTSGPINLTASTLSGTTILGGGNNIQAAIASSAQGIVTVTYTYSVPPPVTVPEPASMALLGLGLAGLGLIRRRSI